jgi:archaellum component FlaC
MIKKDIYKKAVEKFGIKNQIIKTIEELSELQRALCISINENDKRAHNIFEEIADVEIMLAQIKMQMGDNKKIISEYKREKLERLEKLCS